MMATISPQLEEVVSRIQRPGSLGLRCGDPGTKGGSGADSADHMMSDMAQPWSSSTLPTSTASSTSAQSNCPWPNPWTDSTVSGTQSVSEKRSDVKICHTTNSDLMKTDDDAFQTVPTYEPSRELQHPVEKNHVVSIKREENEKSYVSNKLVVPPPPRRMRTTRSHADLGRAVRIAAIKNAEIKQSPVRSNSLFQTLLQRRLWFSLMDELAAANK